jgi:hypothetical protein
MLSQFLLGFGSAFFLAPAMLAAIGGVIADPRNLVSFSVMFGMSQNLGGLLGPRSSDLPDLAREVPLQPAGGPAHHAQPAGQRAYSALYPDVPA